MGMNGGIHDGNNLAAKLVAILRDGADTGVFSIADAKTAAELVMYSFEFYHTAYSEALAARGTEFAAVAGTHLQSALDMQFLMIDRILGLPDKTTNFGWPDLVDRVMETRQPGGQE